MTPYTCHEIPTRDLHQQIAELVKLIEQTGQADPMDAQVIADRRLFRACLDWRVEALIEQLDSDDLIVFPEGFPQPALGG